MMDLLPAASDLERRNIAVSSLVAGSSIPVRPLAILTMLVTWYRSTPLITYLDITYFSGIKYSFPLCRILMYTIFCVRTFGYKVPFLLSREVRYMGSRPVSLHKALDHVDSSPGRTDSAVTLGCTPSFPLTVLW